MPRRLLPIACVAAAIFAVLPVLAHGQDRGRGAGGQRGGGPPPAPPMIKMVKPGLYMVTGIGGNTTAAP